MGGTVPLSEHEQRQLEQIEQALYADHPRLARAMRARDPKVHYRRRLVQACVGFVLGVGALVAGVLLKYPWLDIVGFVIMVASSLWVVMNYRRMVGITVDRKAGDRRGADRRPGGRPRGRRGPAPKAPNAGMMDKLEERWRRRQERDR
jgi:membrane protein implicated in regulation of membrane protease activity